MSSGHGRRLPSLNALKAFEAAARHELHAGGGRLCVTQGAISHQVKALEAELGFRLFHRERQRLVITKAGRSYLGYAMPSTASPPAPSACCSGRTPAFSPSPRRRTLPRSG